MSSIIEMKKSQITIALAIIFIYITYIFLDFINPGGMDFSSEVKFISIVLCFIFTLLIGKNGYDEIDTGLLQFALFLTVIADFSFLILRNNIIGISIFCIVQSLYIVRHSRYKKSDKLMINLLSMIFITISLITISLYSLAEYKPEIRISIVYAGLLLTSVLVSFGTVERGLYSKLTGKIIIFAMILFLLCEISVAVSYMNFKTPIFALKAENIRNISQFLVWVFYLPSQVLLAVSGYKF